MASRRPPEETLTLHTEWVYVVFREKRVRRGPRFGRFFWCKLIEPQGFPSILHRGKRVQLCPDTIPPAIGKLAS